MEPKEMRNGGGPQRGLEARLAEAEARADAAERQLREVLNALPEGVVLLDAKGRYVLWNDAYAQIYHRSADMFAPGRRLMDALREGVDRGDYPDAIGREAAWLAERAARLAAPGERHEQRLSDGRWLMIEERSLTDGGIVGLRVDITDMKQQAAALENALALAQEASRAKSEFLANISHEIRTPLHGVLGMADILLRSPLETVHRERVEVIARSGRMLLALLNDLLDLSKIEAGKLSLTVAPFEVAAVVETACAPFAAIASEKGVALRLYGGAGRETWRLGDELRVSQIISNLVSNAVKFTSVGAVAVFVDEADDGVRITVQDEGLGIPTERLGDLFQKFSQVESAATRQFGGTGLGLAICRELVELMGGRITVASAAGRGSTFTVALPLPACDAPADDQEADLTSDLAGVRILAAEDNPVNQTILNALLAPFGAHLTVVGDGSAAVECARREGFDVILMDIQMPGLDGIGATRRLREIEAAGGLARTPIIALSANVMAHQIADYHAAGMDAVCCKPIAVAELLACIQDALAFQHAAEARAEGVAVKG